MEWTEAQLVAAYRHAKHALYQEHRGVDRLQYASEERRLPQIVRKLKRHLTMRPGWFSGLSLGQEWLVPKRATMAGGRSGVASIGENRRSRVRELSVRVHLAPSVEFAITEVLWLWSFGPALETLLTPAARANRLQMRRGEAHVDTSSRGPFKFWPKAYQAFRDDGFAVAKARLEANRTCILATFDVTSYYDRLDPGFLVTDAFVLEVAKKAAAGGVEFDHREYLQATRTLLAAFGRYYQAQHAFIGVKASRGIPIGAITSRVISNVALSELDRKVCKNREVKYFARYVDDMLMVAVPERPIPRTPKAISERYLPVDRAASKRGEIVLDAGALGRDGSEFRLQKGKLKGFVLRGRQGRDFLLTVERDVREIGSERRAFLHPDGLGTASPLAALVVGAEQDGGRVPGRGGNSVGGCG